MGGLRAPESPPLERSANNSSTPGQRASNRERFYNLRAALWKRSTLPRVRQCGCARRTRGGVGVRLRDGVGGFAGLVTCGSVWVCPVCSRKIAARRALEVGAVVAAAVAEGRTVVLLTLTLRHHLGQPLEGLWDAVSRCWAHATTGRPWDALRASTGLVGYTRAAEVTVGVNGWHPHTHALLIMRGGMTDADIEQAARVIIDRWTARAVSMGLDSPADVGQDARRVSPEDVAAVAEYMSKTHKDVDPSSIGLELTWTQSKTARTAFSTRSMWEVLESAVEVGEASDVALWQEWERSSKGRRALSWSKGLRQLYGLGVEQADEDVAAEELGTVEDTLVWITPAGWTDVVRYRPALIPQILNAVEGGGFVGLVDFLRTHGIDFTRDPSMQQGTPPV